MHTSGAGTDTSSTHLRLDNLISVPIYPTISLYRMSLPLFKAAVHSLCLWQLSLADTCITKKMGAGKGLVRRWGGGEKSGNETDREGQEDDTSVVQELDN